MRVLMLSTPVPTHLAPQIPLAWALRGAGHEVLVAGQPDLVPLAHSAGLSVQVIGESFCANELLSGPPGMRPAHAGRPTIEAIAGGTRVWINHARYLTGPYLAVARQWGPDVIVSDRLEYAALIVGAALGIPVVQHRWGIDIIATSAAPMATRALDGLARRFGVAGLPEPDLILDPAPPSLQSPLAAPGAPSRYVSFNGTGVRPAWASTPDRAVRICVSLGTRTIELNGLPIVRGLADALAELPDVEAIVTIDRPQAERLGPVASNVKLVEPLPINLFLDSCDVVVHHGGCGTLLTAAAAGCSHLVLPQLLDMYEVGDLVEAAGAGLTIEDAAGQESAEVLHGALTALVSGRFATGARGVADEMAGMPSPAEVVESIALLAGPRHAERSA